MGVDKMLPKVSCRELREKPLLRLYLALAVLMLVAMFSATFHHTQLVPERMSSLNQGLLRPPAEFDPAGRRHAIGLLDSRDCEDYNWTRCTDLDRMPVFVYPRNQQEKQPDSWWDSHIYWKAAQRLDDEPQFLVNTTTNPHEACVLISDVNTMCENNQCCGQRKEIVARVRQDSALWDHGRQHFLFNMHDSRPMRIDNAIMLDGGTNLARRRPQDISFALPPRHACCGLDDGITEGQVWDLSRDRKWLLGFKGQRYLHTAVVRFSVRALSAPDEGVMIVSKCMKEEGNFDPWCADDASLYEETDYGQLMFNSTFALVPVGYGLGSYRLIEAMSFGCVPVVLSDGYELPLDELLDWTEFTVIVPEKSWSAVPTILRSISFERLMRMKRRVHEVYWQYFATRERMLAGAIEVLRRRLTALQPVCR